MNTLSRLPVLLAAVLLVGCGQSGTPQPTEEALPSVVVQPVAEREVSAAFEFVGRSEASQRVEVRARVSGTLTARPFREGSEVEAGALMFRIDPAEFEAGRDSARASVQRAEAAVIEAEANLARYEELVQRDAASVARFDEAKAKDATAKADLSAAKAALRKAELDLGYTEIMAPISGRSGRANADVGNLIGPDTGVLAAVVQLDPIHVIFSIGEREYLDYAEERQNGDAPRMTPRIRLANDELYEHPGEFDLIDNEVDPTTGTITVRVKFPNPARRLLPGQFVNVVLTNDSPDSRVVVPQAAIQENQTGPFVLVVDGEGRVVLRPIKTGQRIETDIVALEGLEAGETIIIDGIQKVRPGAKVNPTMASATPDSASATSAARVTTQ